MDRGDTVPIFATTELDSKILISSMYHEKNKGAVNIFVESLYGLPIPIISMYHEKNKGAAVNIFEPGGPSGTTQSSPKYYWGN